MGKGSGESGESGEREVRGGRKGDGKAGWSGEACIEIPTMALWWSLSRSMDAFTAGKRCISEREAIGQCLWADYIENNPDLNHLQNLATSCP